MPQNSLWNESEHPRDESGEFALKGTKKPAAAPATPAAPPPRQTLMFDANKTARLFDTALFEAAKKQKKGKAAAPGPSLLESIEDDLSKQADASKPLGGQREMFCRSFNQTVDRYYRNAELRESIAEAASITDADPSDEQKEAGNYRKGKFRWNGLTIAIENPVGSIRRGKTWQVEMKSHYGYILRNVSEADGDHVDVFVGPHPESDLVCVVDQTRGNGHFDEHKVLIGFTSIKDARAAYLASYSEGWTGLSAITAMTVPQFKKWLECGDTGNRIDAQVCRYSQGHWVTINGTHVYISANKVIKGPANLQGQIGRLRGGKPVEPTAGIKPLAPTAPAGKKPRKKPQQPADPTAEAKRKAFEYAESGAEHFEEWDDEADRAWRNVEIPEDIHFDEWINEEEPQAPPPPAGKSRKAAIHDAARQAAEGTGIPVEDVLKLMPDAQRFLKQEQKDRERGKAWLRKVTGLNAGSLARLENKYQDHSSVKNWDTASREFAGNNPDLGFDPEGDDTPARVWDFLREGKAEYIAAYHPKVAELALQWASPKMRSSDDRQAGDEEEAYQHVERGGESVPFSRARRRAMLVKKFSRLLEKSFRMALTGF